MQRVNEPSPIELKGTIERVRFTNGEFTTGCLRTALGNSIAFAGPIVVSENDRVVLHGHWDEHPQFGRQFRVAHLTIDLDFDVEGLARYLALDPDLKGIGEVKARRIAEAFGKKFERILDEEPERIAEVAGLSIESVKSLREKWTRTRVTNATVTWLAGYGLTHYQITCLVTRFGNNVVGILKGDPYLIVHEIAGFGFKRMDKIARQMGIPKDHPSRIRAGIIECVRERLDRGDCWVEHESLIRLANDLLVMDGLDSHEQIAAHLDELNADGHLVAIARGEGLMVALPELHRMETDLARMLTQCLHANPHFAPIDDRNALVDEFASNLNEGQHAAIVAALEHNQIVISGGAGSGKTFTIAALTRLYEARGLKVVLTAPTGKAAKRLEEVVEDEALTLHRLLEFDGREFQRDSENPIDADVVIVDEVSMVDVPLAWHLYRAIDFERTCVVWVGDHNQLPPVGPGNLLRDLIARRPIPTIVLDKVVRQAGILKENSLAILAGEVRETAEKQADGRRPWYVVDSSSDALEIQRVILELYAKILSERLHFDLIKNVQFLSPQHRGILGVDALNVELQRVIQKKLWGVDVPEPDPKRRPPLFLHDKVIQNRNNYELGVMNGAIGIVASIGPKRGHVRVQFGVKEVEFEPGKNSANDLSLAYALTIHKAQGSEFPCAIVIVHKSHSFMHHRNLLYTAVTRAQKVAILVGDRWGLRNCAKKRQIEVRKTFLSVLDLPPSTPELVG